MSQSAQVKRHLQLVKSVFAERASVGYDKKMPPSGGNQGPPMEPNERISTLEAIIPTLAKKSDVAELRAEMHEGFSANVKWIVGTAIALGAIGLTVITFVLNNASPKTASPTPAPVIITIPTLPAAPPGK